MNFPILDEGSLRNIETLATGKLELFPSLKNLSSNFHSRSFTMNSMPSTSMNDQLRTIADGFYMDLGKNVQ